MINGKLYISIFLNKWVYTCLPTYIYICIKYMYIYVFHMYKLLSLFTLLCLKNCPLLSTPKTQISKAHLHSSNTHISILHWVRYCTSICPHSLRPPRPLETFLSNDPKTLQPKCFAHPIWPRKQLPMLTNFLESHLSMNVCVCSFVCVAGCLCNVRNDAWWRYQRSQPVQAFSICPFTSFPLSLQAVPSVVPLELHMQTKSVTLAHN